MTARQTISKKEQMSQRQLRLYNFLNLHTLASLSSITKNGLPHGCTIFYTVDKKFNCSFLIMRDSRTFANLSKNNEAMMVVYDKKTNQLVQLSGTVSEIKDRKIKDQSKKALLDRLNLKPSKTDTESCACMIFTPYYMRMLIYPNLQSAQSEQPFASIESFDLEL